MTFNKKDLIDSIKRGDLYFWNTKVEQDERDTAWQSNTNGGTVALSYMGQDIIISRTVDSILGTLKVPVGGKFTFKDDSRGYIHSPTYMGYDGGFKMKDADGTTSTWTKEQLLSKKTKVWCNSFITVSLSLYSYVSL